MNQHPTVAPKDQVDDVIHYLRYAARFAPPGDDTPSAPSTPAWFWLLLVGMTVSATTAGGALGFWIALKFVLRFLGW